MIVARLALGAAAAWAAYAWGAHLLAPGCVSRGPQTRRRIALTFDDGPDPVWTERILAVLDREDVRASFFLVGAGVPAGHSLGVIDMRDIAPTLARRLGLTLPAADGRVLLP